MAINIWIIIIAIFLALGSVVAEWIEKKEPLWKRIYLSVATIFLIVTVILQAVAANISGKGENMFQDEVKEYVRDQKKADVPELAGLRVEKKGSGLVLTVKNIGKRTAEKVKIIFRDDSTPSAFKANLIPGAKEIPAGVEYYFNLNIFSGIELLMKLPNSEPGYKENLQNTLIQFEAGKLAFIPRFHIEYYYGEQKFTSRVYYLVLESKREFIYFGCDD
jgi:hypothetical protein